ncbi:MAG: class I SAM-dependent methyltransferase, partial [Planctomycetes bacterium]|nr:class I SAM-dependent methyltransferase [Planctomycetota bacterium]
MPDVVSHAAAAYLVGDGRRREIVLFVLGGILPDALTRAWVLLPKWGYEALTPLHAPVPMVAACALVSLFFAQAVRWEAFKLLLAGAFFHLFLDGLQAHLGGGYPWLFPFSWWTGEVPLFWPEDSMTLYPWLLLLCAVKWAFLRATTPRAEGAFIPAMGVRWATFLYDPLARLTTREATFKSRLLRQAALEPGMEVLDLACGTGTLGLAAWRARPAIRLTGIDADFDVLLRAREKLARERVPMRLHRGFSTALPYAADAFDRVFSTLFFHHLRLGDKRRTLAEIARVLRPGGELHVADFSAPSGPLARAQFFVLQFIDGFETTTDNVRGMLPDLMREAGFAHVEVREQIRTTFGTLALFVARRAAPD